MCMKKIIAVLAAILMLTAVLTACHKKKDDQTADTATKDSAVSETVKPSATTAAVETTAEGATVEKDQEGNAIEISSSGEILSIKDSDGKTVEITTYLETHYFVSAEGRVYGNDQTDGETSDKADAKNDASSKSESKSASSQSEKKQEEATHTIEMPDGSDEYELPIIK